MSVDRLEEARRRERTWERVCFDASEPVQPAPRAPDVLTSLHRLRDEWEGVTAWYATGDDVSASVERDFVPPRRTAESVLGRHANGGTYLGEVLCTVYRTEWATARESADRISRLLNGAPLARHVVDTMTAKRDVKAGQCVTSEDVEPRPAAHDIEVILKTFNARIVGPEAQLYVAHVAEGFTKLDAYKREVQSLNRCITKLQAELVPLRRAEELRGDVGAENERLRSWLRWIASGWPADTRYAADEALDGKPSPLTEAEDT